MWQIKGQTFLAQLRREKMMTMIQSFRSVVMDSAALMETSYDNDWIVWFQRQRGQSSSCRWRTTFTDVQNLIWFWSAGSQVQYVIRCKLGNTSAQLLGHCVTEAAYWGNLHYCSNSRSLWASNMWLNQGGQLLTAAKRNTRKKLLLVVNNGCCLRLLAWMLLTLLKCHFVESVCFKLKELNTVLKASVKGQCVAKKTPTGLGKSWIEHCRPQTGDNVSFKAHISTHNDGKLVLPAVRIAWKW